MTPEQIAGTTEHSMQAAFFCWCSQNKSVYPELEFIFAIPNGGQRNVAVAAKLKAEGVKAGVPDIFLPVTRFYCNEMIAPGLWIEFKRPGTSEQKEGKLSKEQIKWHEYLISQKYWHVVVYDYCQAVNAVVNYLRG